MFLEGILLEINSAIINGNGFCPLGLKMQNGHLMSLSLSTINILERSWSEKAVSDLFIYFPIPPPKQGQTSPCRIMWEVEFYLLHCRKIH